MKTDSAEVVRLYVDENMSTSAIGSSLGVSQRHVFRMLKKEGVCLRPRVASIIDGSDYRLEGKFMPEPNSGCWLWDGTTNVDGYGAIVVDGKRMKAHRVSYVVHKGPIPNGMKILHKCDVRQCINPDHLRLGTDSENQQDMKMKRRSTHGERSKNAKLNEDAVRRIRSSNIPSKELANEYGVSSVTINKVRRKEIWEYVA